MKRLTGILLLTAVLTLSMCGVLSASAAGTVSGNTEVSQGKETNRNQIAGSRTQPSSVTEQIVGSRTQPSSVTEQIIDSQRWQANESDQQTSGLQEQPESETKPSADTQDKQDDAQDKQDSTQDKQDGTQDGQESTAQGSEASQTAEKSESGQGQTVTAPATSDPGWHQIGSYRFFYNSKGKMCRGWHRVSSKGSSKSSKQVYYFRKSAEGEAPRGSVATGLVKIGNDTYYFSSDGVLQTGWKKISGKVYYFAQSGSLGTLGAMAGPGLHKIDGKTYLMSEDGSATIGWGQYKNKKYYFSNSSKLGTRGSAVTGWKKISGYKYYFKASGVLCTNRWISKKYYVDEEGRMLTSTVTPDGYKVDASGVKGEQMKGWVKLDGKRYYYKSGKKLTGGWQQIGGKYYYFDEDGVRQKGWLTLDGATYYLKSGVRYSGWLTVKGKDYYFDDDGEMVTNAVVDGIMLGADGAATGKAEENPEPEKDPEQEETTPAKKKKVLLIAGHGQGDVGAMGVYGSKTYYEYELTRQFTSLIYERLRTSKVVDVTMYDQNYDCYQVLSGKKSGPRPTLTDYNYILEIHFNATVESGKDTKGDGSFKGVGMYVNSSKKNTSIDREIVAAVSQAADFPIWGRGTGIFTSSGLFNARTCQEAKVSYGLLETAFIDDKDDIQVYLNHKEKMAKAVADAINSHYD